MADTVPSHSDWLPGPVQTLEYEGRTVEIECWLSPSPVTLTFPPEALTDIARRRRLAPGAIE